MAGILRSAVAIPRYRLTAAQLRDAWGDAPAGDLAVAFHDEDALTLGVEAALGAGGDGLDGVDLVVAATVSPPFAERSTGTQIAAACDAAAPSCRDLGGSRRAGLGALWLAGLAVDAGGARRAVAVASDARVAEPKDPLEARLGHGAAAFLVGRDGAGADVLGAASAFADYLEVWRVDQERFVRGEGARLERTEALVKPVAAAVGKALSAAGIRAEKVAHLAVGAPDAQAAGAIAKASGIRPEAVVDAGWSAVGDTGTACAPLALCAALAKARPGDVVAAAAPGDGAEAIVLRATDRIEAARPRPPLDAVLGRARPVPSYARLLAWRGLIASAPDAPAVSAVLLHQEEAMLVRRIGYRCEACGLLAYPPARTCQRCRASGVTPHRLGRFGAVFTFTRDRLFEGVEPETAMAVVDLDGGGRVFVQGTDCDPAEISVGTRVELVYRRLHTGGGHPLYYWKARPADPEDRR